MEEVTRIFDLMQLFRNKYSGKEDVFGFKKEGNWVHVSADDYLKKVNEVSRALLALGLEPGDKVATIMSNRPEWNYLDMGIMQSGCVHVPIYPSLSSDTYLYIFQDAQIKLLFIGCNAIYLRVKSVLHLIPSLQAYYILEKTKGVKDWTSFLRKSRNALTRNRLQEIKDSILPDSLATLIYTSGTTGNPKGVMLSHRNVVSNFIAISDILNGQTVNRALSFLPLCHVYERVLNYMYQNMGIPVYYAEGIDQLRENMREVEPDLFCAVPRLLEKSYASILRNGRNLKGFKKFIFFRALHLASRYEFKLAAQPVYRAKLKLADALVFKKWRQAFGGRLRIIVSGGASLHPMLARVFWAAGMQVIEGYGLTETSPVVAVGTFEPAGVKFGTVGRILPNVEVKIAEDGEILVKGPNVMMGYYNNPESNAKVFDEAGWFHTGDIGEMVEGEYLQITDRKKEIFKTSLGKYIAPQVVENRLKESPFIETAMVVGENRNYPSALVVPNFEYLKSWCAAKGIEYTTNQEMVTLAAVQQRILREINQLNISLDHTLQIGRFLIMGKVWTVQSGELSPTLKVRRKFIHSKYAVLIDRIYDEKPKLEKAKKTRREK